MNPHQLDSIRRARCASNQEARFTPDIPTKNTRHLVAIGLIESVQNCLYSLGLDASISIDGFRNPSPRTEDNNLPEVLNATAEVQVALMHLVTAYGLGRHITEATGHAMHGRNLVHYIELLKEHLHVQPSDDQ